ncbi:hypothetical protein TWF730_008483 [Orbilia blumenaviensis]|uniref:Uncharacterized protein n=1 Tax=Orbilia blumenaviensis TaxID=1796055 RepID=A0AAV9V5G7_9PEZI
MATIDTASIRSSNEHELAQYLRKLAARGPVENTTQQLIDAVSKGSIPPSIFKIWLSISHTPIVLKTTLEQDISVRIRKLAIEQLQKLLRSPNWRDTWDGLGAVEEFMRLTRSLPTSDVQDICRAIGSSTKGVDLSKREVITDLFNALENQTTDTRPLARCYQYLVAGCTKEVVDRVMSTPTQLSNHRQQDLVLRNHSDVLRQDFFKMALSQDGPDCPWLFALIRDHPAAPGTNSASDLSSSMEFSLVVLRKLAEEGQISQISDNAFVYELLEPLLKRCLKKGVANEILQEVVELTTKYIERHPYCANIIQSSQYGVYPGPEGLSTQKDIFGKIIECWLRMPDTFGGLFKSILVKTHPSPTRIDIGAFNQLLNNFNTRHRYKIYQFCIQVCTARNGEADVDFDEGLARTTGYLRSHSMPNLDADDALDLFLRLREARGDEVVGGHYIDTICSFFDLAKVSEENSSPVVDLDLWQVYYLRQASKQEEAEALAKTRISERKKAQSSPDLQLRALHARAVLFYAIASGSLPILGDVVNWTRKLVRDSGMTIFALIQSEIYKVLSGFLPSVDDTDASVLRKRVQHANKIMNDLFDILCSGFREPGFEKSNWIEIFCLFHQVVLERMNRSFELQEMFSDEEVYNILWEDTVNFMLELEQKALSNQEIQNIDDYRKEGILDFTGRNTGDLEINGSAVHPSTYRFLDNLAQKRDAMWRAHRISKYPEVAELPQPYPQGLPVQYLVAPFSLNDTPPLDDLAPYIASRVKAVVFPSQEHSLSPVITESGLLLNNIGLFFEDYQYALKLFLSKDLPEEERSERLDSAWAYATGPLSESRMTKEQAFRYWRRSFKDIVNPKPRTKSAVGTQIEKQSKPFETGLKWLEELSDETTPEVLRIPTVDGTTTVLEWDPSPTHEDEIEAQGLSKLTYIDVSTNPSSLSYIESYYESGDKDLLQGLSTPEVPGRTFWHNTIWTRAGNENVKSSFQLQEAQILSALLYLQTRTLLPDRLLLASFPSSDDVRYPSSYLSTECLSKLEAIEIKDKPALGRRRVIRPKHPKTTKGLNENTKAALKSLQAQIKSVPPALILRLVENAFSSLRGKTRDDPEFPALEALAFNLLRLLARSDRPKLAVGLAIQSISEYPAACFWQKPLFTMGLFRDLAPSDAEEAMSKFADTVFNLLEQMEKSKAANQAKVAGEATSSTDIGLSAKEPSLGTGDPESSLETAVTTSPEASPSFVKVSTVKLLIEMFEDGDFLSSAATFSSIHKLCKVTSHVDVHKTVVYYLTRVLKSNQPLEDEFFAILSTIIDKNPETDICKLILDMFNFSLKSLKFGIQHQSLSISVIRLIYKKNTDVELQKKIIEYFTLALDTPISSDSAVQSLFLSVISEMSQGVPDLGFRKALVAYLLHALKASEPDVYDQILDVLSGLTSHCGNITEHEPVTDAKWKSFEDKLELPKCDLWNPVTENQNPILLKLANFYKDIQKNPSLNILFTERIMIPIIKELKSQSSKYFSIFLQQYGIDTNQQQDFKIPAALKYINLITTVLQNGLGKEITPLVEDFVSYAMFNIDPPDTIKQLNKNFEENSELRSIQAVENWWESYGADKEVLRDNKLISFIRGQVGTPEEEIVSASIRENFLKLYKVIFWEESRTLNYRFSDLLLDTLEPDPLDAAWLRHMQPILLDVLQFIDSLRSEEWEQNPNREPQTLPDTFRPRLWLLTIPSELRDNGDQETRCRIFAEEVTKVINEITLSCEFISWVSSIKATLELTHNDVEDDMVIASYLGHLPNTESAPITIQHYTCVDLAVTMLRRRNTTKSVSLKGRIDTMIESWKICSSEAVRKLGYSVKSPRFEPLKEEPPKLEKKPERRKVDRRSGRKKIGTTSRWGPANLNVENTPKRDYTRPFGAVPSGWVAATAW